MQTVSSRWANAIKESGIRITKVDVYDRWSVGLGKMAVPGTLLVASADCSFVSVTEDVDADIRRTASITTSDPVIVAMMRDLDPNPLGVEFVISMGVEYPDGTTELVSKGIFMVDQVDYVDGGGGLELGLVDRSKRLTFFANEEAYTYTTLIDMDDVVDSFLYGTYYANFDSGSVSHAVFSDFVLAEPLTFKVREPLQHINELFANLYSGVGGTRKVYFDAAGVLQLAYPMTIPPGGAWVANHTFRPGPDGDLVRAQVSVQMSGFANNIKVGPTMNEGTGVYDSWIVTVPDPNDVTYAEGPAGYRTKIYDASPDQVADMADMALAYYEENWGLDRRITIEAVGNPAMEVNDVIAVELSTGEEVPQVVMSITHDSTGGMQITGKGQGIS